MRSSVLVLVVAALVVPSSFARAADQTHMFLHNDYSKTHCWGTAGAYYTAPQMAPKTPGPTGAGKSPGLSLLGEGISPANQDPQLAVSPHYVLVLSTGAYVFYDRATNKALAGNGCVPVNALFTNLFAPLMLQKDPATNATNPAYINDHLELGGAAHFKCNASDTSGCVNEVYDARAYYDYDTNRFWIVAAARNQIWTPCDNKGTCPSGCGPNQLCGSSNTCSNCGDEARRYLFVAVSKTEDPRQGFWQYALVRDYADWPLFSVRNDRLILSHKAGKRLYVFDSKKLIAGTTTDAFLGQYKDDSFPESWEISTVTQYSDADGLSLILGKTDSSVTVYAFKDPTKPLVKNSLHLASEPYWRMQPVYRFTKFYFTDDPSDGATGRMKIETHRLTANLNGSPVQVGTLTDDVFTFKKSDASLRMSGVLIEESGAAIVWYAEFPTSGAAPEARYRVLYGNESSFRDSALLRKSEKAITQSSYVGDKQVGGACEPGKLGFWIIHHYTNAAGAKLEAVGKVEPGS